MNVTVKTIPEDQLTSIQKNHLLIARTVVGGVNIYPAHIHDSVKIIGAYEVKTENIFVAPERLQKLSTTMNTSIHELAHHESKADDGTIAHEEAISNITSRVAGSVSRGELDFCLKDAVW